MPIKNWSTTPAANNASPPNGAPEGMAPSAVNDVMRQMMADIRAQMQDGQWFDWGHAPTRVDDDTFAVPGDLTAVYHAGRRLRVGGSGTGYCSIASSSYSSPNTTVNVTMDAGTLPGTLSSVAVSIISAENSASPVGTTGAGASGTWSISISGNAATVTDGLTTANVGSYAPTLTGGGASGTWGINISGSASSATNATNAVNADTVDGQHASAFAAASHDHSGSAITSGTVAAARLPKIGSLTGITIQADPGVTPSGSPGDMFFYY